MRKILSVLMLCAFVVSCSSSDKEKEPGEGGNGNGNGSNMIDERILGKWKVEYSKTIKGARFLEDGTLEIAENAVTTEYFRDVNIPNSGMFDPKEFKIDIKNNNSIIVSPAGGNNKNTSYNIKDGYLVLSDILQHKYSIKDKELTIERIPTYEAYWIYTISRYSKIEE